MPRRVEHDLLPPGAVVRGYTVQRPMGAGGMGLVYEAFSQEQGRRAVIKLLPPGHSAEVEARFANEARATNLVRHRVPGARGIVTIYETGRLGDGNLFIIMEYLEGALLHERLRRVGGRSDAHHLALLAQAARALAAVHAAEVVHRDVKPDNIMLIKDDVVAGGERAVLIDFGIARLPRKDLPEGRSPTQANSFVGSFHYAAPEQRLAPETVDGKADVYALGVILYQLVAGQRPFQGPENEVALLHIREPPPPLPLHARIPGELRGLIHAMLAKNAEERPAMAEVASRLERAALQGTGPLSPAWPATLGKIAGLVTLCGAFAMILRGTLVSPDRRQVQGPDLSATPGPTAAAARPAPDLGVARGELKQVTEQPRTTRARQRSSDQGWQRPLLEHTKKSPIELIGRP